MKAILFRNGIEVRRGDYPRKDMGPVTNLEPGLEWKIIVADPIPSWDNRTHRLKEQELDTDNTHPIYTHLKIYRIQYIIIKRTDAEIKTNIERIERESNELIANQEKFQKFVILALGILIRKSNGISISLKEQNILDKVLAKAVNVWKNDDTVKTKFAAVDNNLDVNMDSNWETSNAED